jgi:two-component system, cell cycle response regulator DivK
LDRTNGRRSWHGVSSGRALYLILYVEDNADIRDAYAIFLRRSGFAVAEAGDGLEGVEQAIALIPDLVLMDLNLPKLDGLEATRRIKMDPRTSHVPVIAISAHHSRAPMAKGPEAMCDGFLAKPMDGAEVVRHVIEVLAAAHKAGASTAQAPPGAGAG